MAFNWPGLFGQKEFKPQETGWVKRPWGVWEDSNSQEEAF